MATFALGSPALPIEAPLGPVGWYHLGLFGLFMPYAAIKSRGRLKAMPQLPSLRAWLIRALVMLVVGAALSVIVARMQWIWLRWLVPSPLQLGIGAAILGLMVMIARPMWRNAVAGGSRSVALKMPRTLGERALWIAVSLGAGVGEEITYRGVQVALLATWIGNPWIAVVVSAVTFAVAHAIQDLKSIVFIFVFSLVMSVLVAVTGSLILPILIHASFDVIAGFTYARFGRELGYQPPLPVSDAPAEETAS